MLIVIRTEGNCELLQGIDTYVMRGPTGEHVLHRDVTDKARLEAHWRGFVSQQPAPAPAFKAGEHVQVWSNQAMRDGTVLAVLGNEALVEYYMEKSDTSALLVFEIVNGTLFGRKGAPLFLDGHKLPRSVSYRKLPQKWAQAMRDQGMTHWVGRPQQCKRGTVIPCPGRVLVAGA